MKAPRRHAGRPTRRRAKPAETAPSQANPLIRRVAPIRREYCWREPRRNSTIFPRRNSDRTQRGITGGAKATVKKHRAA
jgi:hypothetical protein